MGSYLGFNRKARNEKYSYNHGRGLYLLIGKYLKAKEQ